MRNDGWMDAVSMFSGKIGQKLAENPYKRIGGNGRIEGLGDLGPLGKRDRAQNEIHLLVIRGGLTRFAGFGRPNHLRSGRNFHLRAVSERGRHS